MIRKLTFNTGVPNPNAMVSFYLGAGQHHRYMDRERMVEILTEILPKCDGLGRKIITMYLNNEKPEYFYETERN